MAEYPLSAPPPVQAPPSNLPEFTVSELAGAIKRTLEGRFDRVRVRGEISSFKKHGSGHLYLCLKDADSVIDAVVWKTTALRLRVKPEDGLEVIATGRVTTFPGRSKYQLVIDQLEVAGAGALLKLLEERRQRLAAEGLFASERKKPLPFLPEVIGVITSPTGAVIRDILHRLADRFPRRVLLWPVAVQGEGAAEQVARAIRGFNALAPGGAVPRPDLLIVARGGGSLEDLWAFNEEIVVRAAAESRIPLISAVGHETDTTLIDFAADKRAPTPTAAAEIAVPVRADLLAQVVERERRLVHGINRMLGERRMRIEGLARGLPEPARLIAEKEQRLDQWVERILNARGSFFQRRQERLNAAWARVKTPRERVIEQSGRLDLCAGRLQGAVRALLQSCEHRHHRSADRLTPALALGRLDRQEARLKGLGDLLESFSFERVLERGFVLVCGVRGGPITSSAAIAPGMGLRLRFRDGERHAIATEGGGGRGKPKGSGDDTPQGSLL
ncbi:MAG TPA: exodeoxyribonuclease VII large subunit [Methylomirabilota bacterium]|jgi:exodeoxyribonuclease VII large subunit|nr:exodeoxyribonuclease VII large subunit [Methylomirabilota bacterium]